MFHSSSGTPADGPILIISLRLTAAFFPVVYIRIRYSKHHQSNYPVFLIGCKVSITDITRITVSDCSKSKDHMAIKKLLLLTHMCSQQPTYAHHCNFYSSPPKSFLPSSPHHWKASFEFMQTCTSASHLLPSFLVSGQVSDLIYLV